MQNGKPEVSRKRWRIVVAETRARGKFSACLGADEFEIKTWERHTTKQLFARSLLNEAAIVWHLVKRWPEESPYGEELPLLLERASGWHNVPTCDKGCRNNDFLSSSSLHAMSEPTAKRKMRQFHVVFFLAH